MTDITKTEDLDVLCIGHASYDLIFSVPHHPGPDEKTVAHALTGCGGGPAANAAVMVAKLGFQAGCSAYLGHDVYGDSHFQELLDQQVNTQFMVRGIQPTPLSVILVKPDGKRSLINYKGETIALPKRSVDYSQIRPKVLLFDGHEPQLSLDALAQTLAAKPFTVLDAGSMHAGTLALMTKVDYLVCSEKFALQYAGDSVSALRLLAEQSAVVVITLGEHGLLWRRGAESGVLAAPPIAAAIDTTGAGDAFHGAFAAGLVTNMNWLDLLRYASVAGGLCCTQLGARTGLPERQQVAKLLADWQ